MRYSTILIFIPLFHQGALLITLLVLEMIYEKPFPLNLIEVYILCAFNSKLFI